MALWSNNLTVFVAMPIYWLDSAFGYFLKIERKKEGKREQINKYGIFNELG